MLSFAWTILAIFSAIMLYISKDLRSRAKRQLEAARVECEQAARERAFVEREGARINAIAANIHRFSAEVLREVRRGQFDARTAMARTHELAEIIVKKAEVARADKHADAVDAEWTEVGDETEVKRFRKGARFYNKSGEEFELFEVTVTDQNGITWWSACHDGVWGVEISEALLSTMEEVGSG